MYSQNPTLFKQSIHKGQVLTTPLSDWNRNRKKKKKDLNYLW